jgi:hypothetical protein
MSSSASTGGWGLVASLAAAAAAGAYTAHLSPAYGMPPGWDGRLETPESDAASSSSGGGGGNTAGTAGDTVGGTATARPFIEDCTVCSDATTVWVTLCCLERGVALASQPGSAARAVLAEAARQQDTTLQQYLRQQLLELAWRHPVPGVCGNVLCARLVGPSAVGAVQGLVGSWCGRCRAAWYCCEGCQRAARGAHKVVCRAVPAP